MKEPNVTSPTSQILFIRGKRVILDSDLAELYGVPTKQLNQQVKRNPERFPSDFAFILSPDEWDSLRSQIATLKTERGRHRKFLPYVFTEHGALMAAGVLNSQRAIDVSIFVVRTFVAMREAAIEWQEVASRIDEVERRLGHHDLAIGEILNAIRALMQPPEHKQRPIGFVAPPEGSVENLKGLVSKPSASVSVQDMKRAVRTRRKL